MPLIPATVFMVCTISRWCTPSSGGTLQLRCWPAADSRARTGFVGLLLLWGSDWPVLELAATYDDWWADTQTALAGLTATDRAAVLGGNAMQVYRL